jgi:hypothetical protein
MTEEPKMTAYFREQVLRKRPYLKIEWCLAVIANPATREVQEDGRMRFWGYIPELIPKALRVVTLEDGETLHNAFPDSGYTRRNR